MSVPERDQIIAFLYKLRKPVGIYRNQNPTNADVPKTMGDMMGLVRASKPSHPNSKTAINVHNSPLSWTDMLRHDRILMSSAKELSLRCVAVLVDNRWLTGLQLANAQCCSNI